MTEFHFMVSNVFLTLCCTRDWNVAVGAGVAGVAGANMGGEKLKNY